MSNAPEPRFIVDNNVAKLARWLRIMGYDAISFEGGDDRRMIDLALGGGRVMVTRDRQIMKRRVITSGRLKAILIEQEWFQYQMRQLVRTMNLKDAGAFSLCVECNRTLLPRRREEVEDLVPPHVYLTHTQYMQCPSCRRVYWQGSHWAAMRRRLEESGWNRDGDTPVRKEDGEG
ncbi:MAG: Mut7-C RNAse domain-containing protein [Dehalococcoidia bacterium]|nr:Mut7-C RNAse domain-containing protein [Dehalococcoidia bacterium]